MKRNEGCFKEKENNEGLRFEGPSDHCKILISIDLYNVFNNFEYGSYYKKKFI